ncbi:hypothetical protein GCM10020256_41200 [Streptomyces thermocoprophilus]
MRGGRRGPGSARRFRRLRLLGLLSRLDRLGVLDLLGLLRLFDLLDLLVLLGLDLGLGVGLPHEPILPRLGRYRRVGVCGGVSLGEGRKPV